MFKFKVLEKKDSKMESIIEKSGIKTTFTLSEVLNHLEHVKKTLNNTQVQLNTEAMQDELAIKLVPEIATLPEDKWQIIESYAQRKLDKEEKLKLIDVCNETIKTYSDVSAKVSELLEIEDTEKEFNEYILEEMKK